MGTIWWLAVEREGQYNIIGCLQVQVWWFLPKDSEQIARLTF